MVLKFFQLICGATQQKTRNFDEMGLSGDEIIPIKADANDLPFAHEFFNAIICADSYNYFEEMITF